MTDLPEHEIRIYSNGDSLPAEAEELFASQLAYSRQPLPADRPDRDKWRFVLACAVTDQGHVLGGVHIDVGPANFGPLKDDYMGYLERSLVRPEYRRRGLGTRLLMAALAEAARRGATYVRCHADWDNPAEIAMYRRCGFALTDISENGGEYFAVKPL